MVSESDVAEQVGAEIRRLREQARLSTRQLAQLAGISQPFLSQVERGASAPSMYTTYRLAGALGVRPGVLLPPADENPVTLVRSTEGRMLPVANRDDAAAGRTLLMHSHSPLEVIEFVVAPHQHLEEWFQRDGEMATYLISGLLDVEIERFGIWRLHPRDLLHHDASLRHRWRLVDDQPAHVLFMLHNAQDKHPSL